jgi:hypothetical protein
MILAPICSASFVVNDGVRPPEMTLTRTWTANYDFFFTFGPRNLLASGQEPAQSIREDP